jgi:hypothetical protein
MSEQVEVFQAMREARRQRHREWKRANVEALHKHGLYGRVTNHGECIVFRFGYSRDRWIKADFYPSTGRWRSNGKNYSGGGEKFAAWWNQQIMDVPVNERCPF